jgi:hypothetical protein
MTTDVIAASAAVLCIAVAARSTWSPCGLSMLATITPLAERGRGHQYGGSAAWFVAGGLLGGATLGGLAAALAAGLRALAPSSASLAAVALAGAALTVVAELGLGGFRLPVHHRQVNERWLDQFRPWVYAGGFGWQVGTGLATYIMTPALYLLILLSALTGAPWAALALASLFGLLRGLAVLLGRGITDPTSLARFHRRFHDAEPVVRRVLVAVECAVTFACAWLVSPWAALAVAGVGAAVGVARLHALRRATSGAG